MMKFPIAVLAIAAACCAAQSPMAECYRKLGRNEEALAAYGRVAQEFPDQAKLAGESRNLLSAGYRVQTPQAAAPITPEMEAARRRYREELQNEVQIARELRDIRQRQFQVGAISAVDNRASELDAKMLETEPAAYDAGWLQPSGIRN